MLKQTTRFPAYLFPLAFEAPPLSSVLLKRRCGSKRKLHVVLSHAFVPPSSFRSHIESSPSQESHAGFWQETPRTSTGKSPTGKPPRKPWRVW